jgi:hypothetical protein
VHSDFSKWPSEEFLIRRYWDGDAALFAKGDISNFPKGNIPTDPLTAFTDRSNFHECDLLGRPSHMRRLLYVALGLALCIGSASQATAGVVDAGDPSINLPGVHISFDVNSGNGDVTNVTGTAYGNPVTGSSGGSLIGPNGYIDFTTSAGDYIITASNGVYSISMPEPSTWAMMALGFAGLAFAGYRAARKNAPASAS